jgi:hypothetical protein
MQTDIEIKMEEDTDEDYNINQLNPQSNINKIDQ